MGLSMDQRVTQEPAGPVTGPSIPAMPNAPLDMPRQCLEQARPSLIGLLMAQLFHKNA